MVVRANHQNAPNGGPGARAAQCTEGWWRSVIVGSDRRLVTPREPRVCGSTGGSRHAAARADRCAGRYGHAGRRAEYSFGCAVNTALSYQQGAHNSGYARASYASGGGGASRVPRIAGDVTAGSALVSCVLVSDTPGAERRRF